MDVSAVYGGGRRSFFAKGYCLENIVPGGVIGIPAAALPMVIEYVSGDLQINGFVSGADFRLPFYGVFKNSLFAGIVFFGYIFHILQKDIGNICAVTVSSLLYTAFGLISVRGGSIALIADIHSHEGIVYVLTLLLTGIAGGIFIVSFGDMRSAAAFICLKNFTENAVVMIMSVSCGGAAARDAGFMYGSLISPVALGILCLWLFVSAVKKR